MTFEEYRVLVQPSIENPGQWAIHVQKAPRANFLGRKQPTTPAVLPADLAHLRNNTAPADLDGLRKLGRAVLNSILPAAAQAQFEVSLDDVLADPNKGLRVVVSVLGNTRVAGGVGCHEIPIEAMFADNLNFLATNARTPVSRGLTVEADRPSVKIAAPLRILLVISEPNGMPPVKGAEEATAIMTALEPLIKAGGVKVDRCIPPTAARLDSMLQQQKFHIVHFIGHGDFEVDGLDPNPQPYLYFEDDTPNRERRAIDSEQMYTMLRNGSVPLVVMTACSSAASKPNGPEYPGLAFESLAQTLVERSGGPLAAVAMQFDFETEAASVFSRALYEKLLSKDMTIDAAVASARVALVARFSAGHRSWVNPTVYWRCVDGRPFDLVPVSATGTLTPEQQTELVQIDALLSANETVLKQIAQSTEEAAIKARLLAEWQARIQELLVRRGIVLGDTIRLTGGRLAADGNVECSLVVQLRTAARIGAVRVSVAFDATEFAFVSATAGVAIVPASFLTQPPNAAGDPAIVLVQDASAAAEWGPGEHEIARIRFRALNGMAQPLFRIPLKDLSISRNNAADPSFGTMDAVVFPP